MKELDDVLATMYRSVCFEKGSRPDWSLEDAVFAPGARLVRVTDDGVFEFDLASYRTNFESMIDSGGMPSLWEGETWRETKLFGDVAQVLSAYETRPAKDGPLLTRGVNCIQLFRRDGRWWISAMIWRREGRDVRIADKIGS